MTTAHDIPTDSGEFVSVAEACQITGLGCSTIRGYIASGRLPKYRVGERRVVVKRSHVDALFTKGK